MSHINLNFEWEFYYPKVYGYFFRRLSNRLDTEDLTSLVLFQFLETLADEQKVSKIVNKNAYLWKIAHNQLVNFINRKSKLINTVSLDDNLESIDSTVDAKYSNEFNQRIEHLRNCIKISLNNLDFEIVNLSLIEDKKSPEVAKIVNITAENVRKRLSRAVNKLKEKCRSVWQN